MPNHQKSQQEASDQNEPPVEPLTKEIHKGLDDDVLAKLAEAAASVGYSNGIKELAERLIARIATRGDASETTGFRQKETELVRSYDILRQELAGPADVNALVDANIRAIIPPWGYEGKEIRIWVENAGHPSRVAFAAPAGGTVSVAPKRVEEIVCSGTGKVGEAVVVDVPPDAVTGKITVITDRGEPTSRWDFVIGREFVDPVGLEHLGAGLRKGWSS